MKELLKYIETITGKNITGEDIFEMNPAQLAFVGDSIYDVFVRTYLLAHYKEPVNKLHKRAVEFVRASAQSESLARVYDILCEDELYVVKRGRNTKSANTPSGADMIEYRRATAFETLLGYLYLTGKHDRLFCILSKGSGIDSNHEKEDIAWDK